jgi:hypothetical protein
MMRANLFRLLFAGDLRSTGPYPPMRRQPRPIWREALDRARPATACDPAGCFCSKSAAKHSSLGVGRRNIPGGVTIRSDCGNFSADDEVPELAPQNGVTGMRQHRMRGASERYKLPVW